MLLKKKKKSNIIIRTVLWLRGKESVQETQVRSLGQEVLLEEGIATHSGILAWKIPRTEEPGGLQFKG